MRIQIELAHGGDERIAPGSLLYLRAPTPSESESEPGAQSVLRLRGIQFLVTDPCPDLAAEFAQHITITPLATPSGKPVWVNLDAVLDWDPTPSTAHPEARSWLVFGSGPRAPRLAVQETEDQLIALWTDLNGDLSVFDAE